MPWNKDSVPSQIKGLPSAAISIWVAAANGWLSSHSGDDTGAVKYGWGAVKQVFKKVGDKWVRKTKKAGE